MSQKMRAVQIGAKGSPLELVEKDMPEPGPGQVRVKVEACGICRGDNVTVAGLSASLRYPRVPGHEIAGTIDALGAGVTGWTKGQRVGLGWFGGHCGVCEACRRGDFIACSKLEIPGIAYDGGYAEYMVAPISSLASIPDDLASVDAAPLLCAGVTTFNALRHSGARAGSLVAVQGLGGLGHLGVQFAAKLGYETVAIARGKEKEPFAKKLGAKHYIDSDNEDIAARLKALGGAQLVLSTITDAKAMSRTIDGLGYGGKLLIVGVARDPLEVTPGQLVGGHKSIEGWYNGQASDSQDTLAFSVNTGVKPMIETMPLERAAEAFAKMMSGQARFRMVLTMG
ncbi:alcohol dehydrogenase [Methyloferula stellata]|uniref:alcohol dehydrogenase n=1 Tax=Methyloferula stellata TaxID=876270 RepID=UPI0003758A5C|nr:alcohol dehydrogenase [Methyloferula stellata]